MSKFIYGVDIGGTNIKLGLFLMPEMKLLVKEEMKTPTENQKIAIFALIAKCIEKVNKKNGIDYGDIEGIGLAVPCPVKNGRIKQCPNLEWDNMSVINAIKELIPKGVEVAVSNDATLAALGENESLQNPYNNAVFYTIGTGVGGGLIIDGEIFEGGSGLGGEIGHMRVFEGQSVACGCGSQGCLEQICGTAGILNYTKELAVTKTTKIDLANLSVKSIFDAAKTGDDIGLKVVNRFAEHIAISASILAVIVDPDVFIIGGGVSQAGEFLIDIIVKKYQKHARFSTMNVPFLLAKSGNNAGFIGAAYLVKKKIHIKGKKI